MFLNLTFVKGQWVRFGLIALPRQMSPLSVSVVRGAVVTPGSFWMLGRGDTSFDGAKNRIKFYFCVMDLSLKVTRYCNSGICRNGKAVVSFW